MISALMPYLASAILISSNLTALPQQTTTEPSSFPLTRVISDDNFVVYTIEKGETLKIIAGNIYNNQDLWTNIWNNNTQISDPDDLAEGYLIKLQISVPEKTEELTDTLQEKLSKLHPRPASAPVFVQPEIKTEYLPQSSYEEVYKTAGTKYGIPWQILYGIHMTETGCRNGAIFNGHGSGAQGPMQFMPGTWNAYGADGDGDNINDINNAVDAIHGAANYLTKHGSLENGLHSYGGNYSGILAYARAKGYDQ